MEINWLTATLFRWDWLSISLELCHFLESSAISLRRSKESFQLECFEGVKFIWILPYRVGSKWIFRTNHFNLSVLKQSFWFGCFEGAISIWVFWGNHYNFGVLKESFQFECFEGVKFIWTLPYRVGSKWIFQTNHFNLKV